MVNASMVQSKAPLWYVCRLSPQPCTRPHNVGNTIGDICHALSSSITYSFILGALAALFLTRAAAFGQIPPPSVMVPPPTGAPVAQPNKHIYKPRPNAPPVGEWDVHAKDQDAPVGEWDVHAKDQDAKGHVWHLRGHAEMENVSMLFRADEIDYNEDTGDV